LSKEITEYRVFVEHDAQILTRVRNLAFVQKIH